ncbi:MAG TPA: hypothetical protein VGT41_02460 [Candidatus Babeliales bacterium]|nr:hypothetical protein [Candidatus Babeliales bacterium]
MRWYMIFGLFCVVWVAGGLIASNDSELTVAVEIPDTLLSQSFSIEKVIPVVIKDGVITVANEQDEAPVPVQAEEDMPLHIILQLDDLRDLPQVNEAGQESFWASFFMKHPYVSFGGVVSLVWFVLASFDPELRDIAKDTVKKMYKTVRSSVSRAYRSVS